MYDDLDNARDPHSKLMPLLLHESEFDDPRPISLAPPMLPGLRLFMALDLPEGPHVLSVSEQQDLGGSTVVYGHAMENLANLGIDGLKLRRGADGARFYQLTQDSPFIASLVSLLRAVVPAATGRELPAAGALVAVPTGRHLLFHPLENLSIFAASLNAMGNHAHALYAEADDGLSPSVFWWHHLHVAQVTSFENGEATITIDKEFQAVLESLEGQPVPASAEDLLASPDQTRQLLAKSRVLLDFDLVLEVTGGLLGRGHADIARLLAKQAGKSGDRKVRAAGNLADALLDAAEGKAKRALSALKSMAKSNDPDVVAEAASVRGMVLEQQNRMQEAEQQYRLAMGMRRPTAAGRAALNLAALLVRTGDDAGAVTALQIARTGGVPHLAAQAAVELAVACERAGDAEMAMRYYLEGAQAPVPEVATPAAFVLGEMLRERGRLEEARMALESVATSGHELAQSAVVRLGLVHLATGNPAEATVCFRSVAQGTDPDAAAHATLQLGFLAHAQGELELAVDLLGKAARSGNAQVRMRAADALRQLGAAGEAS
ncbi:tetratricopeptide (TPR) repeat protein [Catenulispora sp. MAP5-51]|uniref:hypothetical protein n=1 Tax=Catenulispora sp. MAP5-51 TaxID=3156298 RepID=UPI00351379DD